MLAAIGVVTRVILQLLWLIDENKIIKSKRNFVDG
jgi:hypothetical protein